MMNYCSPVHLSILTSTPAGIDVVVKFRTSCRPVLQAILKIYLYIKKEFSSFVAFTRSLSKVVIVVYQNYEL